MKKILFIIIILLSGSQMLYAESLYPNEVVKLFIQGLQQNDLQKVIDTADLLKIASHPRHAMSAKQLVKFFKDVDLDKIIFQKTELETWPKNITVRILKPISYDFDLELQEATFEEQESYYIITSVHP